MSEARQMLDRHGENEHEENDFCGWWECVPVEVPESR